MMFARCAFALLALSATAAMHSCSSPVQFLHPLGDSASRTFVAELSGQWEKTSGSGAVEELWTFAPDKDKHGYTLTVENPSDKAKAENAEPPEKLRIELVKLGGSVFLDCTAADRHDSVVLIPVHLFGKIEIDGATVRINMIEDNWLTSDRMTAAGWAHETIANSDVLITAPTVQLQQMMQKWDADLSVEKNNEVVLRRAAAGAR